MGKRVTRRRIGYLAVASLFIRLALVTLFMPVASSTSQADVLAGADIVLCTVHGPMQVAPDSGDPQNNSDDSTPRFCPFCLGLSSITWAVSPDATAITLPLVATTELPPTTNKAIAEYPHARPSARGPPSLLA